MTDWGTYAAERKLKKRRRLSKYNARHVEIGGIKFDSKAEGRRYEELKLLQRAGEVLYFLRQVPLHLPGNVKYVVDFVIFYADGSVVYEDVKGYETPMFKMKKKMVESIYPIEIIINKMGRK